MHQRHLLGPLLWVRLPNPAQPGPALPSEQEGVQAAQSSAPGDLAGSRERLSPVAQASLRPSGPLQNGVGEPFQQESQEAPPDCDEGRDQMHTTARPPETRSHGWRWTRFIVSSVGVRGGCRQPQSRRGPELQPAGSAGGWPREARGSSLEEREGQERRRRGAGRDRRGRQSQVDPGGWGGGSLLPRAPAGFLSRCLSTAQGASSGSRATKSGRPAGAWELEASSTPHRPS